MQYTQGTTNDQSTLRRRIVATAMATGVVLFGVAVAPGVASAHHPILSGTTSCRTDACTVTWTATADADRNLTWSITSPAGYSPGGFQDDQTAFTRSATYPGTQASAAETVTAEWSNGNTASATATVDRRRCAGRPHYDDHTYDNDNDVAGDHDHRHHRRTGDDDVDCRRGFDRDHHTTRDDDVGRPGGSYQHRRSVGGCDDHNRRR